MPTILHVTDMQGDFGAEDGVLYVPGGADVAKRINQFMDDIPAGIIDGTVFTYDTHPWFSYFSSDECIPFPNIHCEQGKSGWELVVDPSKMDGKSDVVYAPKETFDYWGDKATNNIVKSTRHAPASATGHAYFQKHMAEDGYKFLPRDAKIEEFAVAVGHDLSQGPYKGKITVLPYDSTKIKGREGYYIRQTGNETEIIALADKKLVDVYDNIGTLTSDKECLEFFDWRDQLNRDLKGTKVVMTGLATNFCVFDAMLGYLERGARVYAIEDLMAGIPNGEIVQQALLDATGVDRTASGDIKDVMQTAHFKKYVDSGQLVLIQAKDFLTLANAIANKEPVKTRKPGVTLKPKLP